MQSTELRERKPPGLRELAPVARGGITQPSARCFAELYKERAKNNWPDGLVRCQEGLSFVYSPLGMNMIMNNMHVQCTYNC